MTAETMTNDLDAFNVTRVHDGAFEELDFSEVTFDQRLQFEFRPTTDNAHETSAFIVNQWRR